MDLLYLIGGYDGFLTQLVQYRCSLPFVIPLLTTHTHARQGDMQRIETDEESVVSEGDDSYEANDDDYSETDEEELSGEVGFWVPSFGRGPGAPPL